MPNVLLDKSFNFAIKIVNLYKDLSIDRKEYVLSKQLLRSGTSVGALIREAQHAESKADFIHKLSVALKEANENDYWLELLHKTDYMDQSKYLELTESNSEVIRILISSIKTVKNGAS